MELCRPNSLPLVDWFAKAYLSLHSTGFAGSFTELTKLGSNIHINPSTVQHNTVNICLFVDSQQL